MNAAMLPIIPIITAIISDPNPPFESSLTQLWLFGEVETTGSNCYDSSPTQL